MAESLKAYRADPYSYVEARRLADELGLSEPLAITLVRRGYRTPAEAQAFLSAEETHDPSEFNGMDDVCSRLLATIEAGRAITVFGDFDVDGVCSTTIAISALRSLGARCDWLIPDRQEDGYGLGSAAVRRLHERGTSLILTVDCAITAVEEVTLAQELGMEVIVTDHHQPKDELPSCPIIHPRISGYPFEDLCGTAVAWKLATALRRAAGEEGSEAGGGEEDLDLVALATVADLVPLTGENRNLVRRGLAVARRAERPGFAALAGVGHCDVAKLDEGDMAFRLGPRINAAGRLYRADAGVELMLTEDPDRAAAIAEELDRANMERRFTEREVANGADTALRALPDDLREAKALVLAGEGWHPGVVGIVASRVAEEHNRPAILLSVAADGSARGSGRSIPGFDLLAGLEACAGHLTRFGGHRAAAGLELPASEIDAFRAAFAAHAEEAIGPDQMQRTQRIDAVVGGQGIGMGLAEEIGRLAPFGNGNPGVRLLVPSARLRDVKGMGQEGRHSRFNLHSGAHRAAGVAFGRSSLGVGDEDSVDVAVRLEVNEWNGSVEPRLVLSELYPVEGGKADADDAGSPRHECSSEATGWWQRFERELDGGSEIAGVPDEVDPTRTIVNHGSSATAVLAELVSSGERVLAVCADAARRGAIAEGAAGLARFGGGKALVSCGRCEALEMSRVANGAEMLVLVDYAALTRARDVPESFGHVVLIDPPASAAEVALVSRGATGESTTFLHPVWGESERAFAQTVLDEQLGLRAPLRTTFRDLREAAPCSGSALRAALMGQSRYPRSPELAARCAAVLEELGLVHWDAKAGTRTLGVVSSEGTKLELSAAFRAYRARHQDGRLYLERLKQP